MDVFCGVPVVTDDALYRRAAAAGLGFEDEADAYCWLAERHYDTGAWPRCGCAQRCRACPDVRFIRSTDGQLAFQQVDPQSGQPRPPDWERYRREALAFACDHRNAQAWLPNPADDRFFLTDAAAALTARDEPTFLGYPVADLVAPDY